MSSCTSSSSRFVAGLAASAVLGGAVFLFGTELLIRQKVLPEDHFPRHVELFNASANPNAAFGDSHVARGFTGKSHIVNLAYPSERISQLELKIRTYFADKRPGMIVLQADPHMFAPYRIVASDRDYARIFAENGDIRPWLYAATPQHRRKMLAYWRVFLFDNPDFRSNVRFNTDGSLLSDDDLSEMPARRVRLDATNRVRLHKPYSRFEEGGFAQQYAAVLDYLDQAGADVCMVTFPVSPAYRLAAAERDEFARARRFFADLARQYGASYRNYWAAYDRLELFRDPDHLNETGAELFSTTVLKDCFGV